QVRGMFHGDRSRKQTLVDYGFRMPSALDNRPLTFEEFEHRMNQVVYVSATPGPYEQHLAYAPEIAQAMLRRQQASAVVAARTRIVEGAVGMVEMALEELSKRSVVVLDEERKAAMVSNLLVVLCSEQNTQPVVNTGSLYT